MEYLIETTSTDFENYDGKIELEDLQEAVGGLIEVVHLQSSIMIVNEEGLILELPFNPMASNIANMPIVGDAVLLTAESIEEFMR